MMLKPLILVLVNVLIGAGGQLMLKAGMSKVGRLDAEALLHPMDLLIRIFTTPLILMALPLYGLALVLWLVAISRLDLSFAYPILALAFLVNPLLARVMLGEQIPSLRWVGILVICTGVLIVGLTAERA